jgi:hypothetical protein
MHSIQLLSRSRLTPHQHTRVLRRRTDTGSQTRTSSRTTHYEIEPPAVSGHQPPPGRTQTSPGPGTILPGAPNPRRAFGHVHRPMGKGGGLGNYIGGAVDVPPWTQAPRITEGAPQAGPALHSPSGLGCHTASHARVYARTMDLASQPGLPF